MSQQDHLAAGPVGVAVVGASAGGVEALCGLVSHLPADLACPVVVVLHVSAAGTSALPQILRRAGALTVAAVEVGEPLRAGHVHVAPPDRHVLVTEHVLALSSGPRENGHRPAVDPTMRSAAEAFGARALGILVSGTRDDGTAGLGAIKARGGRAAVQDPEEALYAGMPRSALDHVRLDAVLGVAGLARWLADAAAGSPPTAPVPGPPAPGLPALALAPPIADESFVGDSPSGDGTRFTCPDCGGVFFEVTEGGVHRLLCSVGHVWSPESFAAAQGRELERALSTAMRALEDRAVLMGRMAARARASGHLNAAAAYDRQTAEAREHAGVVRRSMQRYDDTAAADAERRE
jgi:two-component system chemotaxis response regulator CheB